MGFADRKASHMAYGVLGAAGKLNEEILEAAREFVAQADGALMPDVRAIHKVDITRCKQLLLEDEWAACSLVHPFRGMQGGGAARLRCVEVSKLQQRAPQIPASAAGGSGSRREPVRPRRERDEF